MNKPLITIASGNPKKVAEIEAMLGPLPIEVKRQPSSLDVEETGKTYFENALLKAKAAAKLTKSWTIADDSGLEVDALNGAPGLFSARYAKSNEAKLKKLHIQKFLITGYARWQEKILEFLLSLQR